MNDTETMIDTLLGPLPAAEVEVITGSEKVPCGECKTTMYFYGGELVRQDQQIIVDRGLVFGGKGGLS